MASDFEITVFVFIDHNSLLFSSDLLLLIQRRSVSILTCHRKDITIGLTPLPIFTPKVANKALKLIWGNTTFHHMIFVSWSSIEGRTCCIYIYMWLLMITLWFCSGIWFWVWLTDQEFYDPLKSTSALSSTNKFTIVCSSCLFVK